MSVLELALANIIGSSRKKDMTSWVRVPVAGGFSQSTLPSPPPSSAASDVAPQSLLPRSRDSPLKPGGHKQSGLIDYVDNKLLNVSRRYEKRFSAKLGNEDGDKEGIPIGDTEMKGYNGFAEMARDLNAVIDVVWVSGTPSLQIPYFLTIALTTTNALSPFQFSPRATFLLLKRLDAAFSSLLRGVNVETGEQLPGIRGKRGRPSITESIRLKSIVERTRVAIVEAAGKGESVTDGGNESGTDYDAMTDDDFDDDMTMQDLSIEDEDDRWEMEIARVYERTVTELGSILDVSESGPFG
ncbi:uncharacterized protein KY384_001428 [Bacidia gigantensis]|uniref:uncharacterized protein n=1 Tax=Bacidia gigantensis TaxID=2732470 RepID=UPI001D05BBFE|nr:uncharacterized protein KY384_001428 [Bacidia gigantensis]KAG8533687.1 hypothetical protein KY384_001428 [Bacidia gigantensis]